MTLVDKFRGIGNNISNPIDESEDKIWIDALVYM